MQGWVKIFRKTMEWEWYQDSNMVHLLLHFILRANHKIGFWKGIPIKPGQFISGRKILSAETGISERTIRTCLERMKKSNIVSIKTTNKYSLYELIGWKNHLPEDFTDQQSVTQPANNRPTNDQQPTTNNNDKNNNKNEKKLNARSIIFKKILDGKIKKYGYPLISSFYRYWSEPDFEFKKMRFEFQKTWDTDGRLQAWVSRETSFKGATRSPGKLPDYKHPPDPEPLTEEDKDEINRMKKKKGLI